MRDKGLGVDAQISVGKQVHVRDNLRPLAQVNFRRQKFFAVSALGNDFAARIDDLGNARAVDEDDENLIFDRPCFSQNSARRQTFQTPRGRHKQNFRAVQSNFPNEFGKTQVVTNRQAALYAVKFDDGNFIARAENFILARDAEQMRLVVSRDDWRRDNG